MSEIVSVEITRTVHHVGFINFHLSIFIFFFIQVSSSHQSISNLQRKAIVNTINNKLSAQNETEIIRPIPSPGVVRRGSIEGLQRSSSLRNRGEKSKVTPPKLGIVNRCRSNSVPDEATEDGETNDDSVTNSEVEIMRQFVAKDKKIINRGDSIR